MAKYIHLPLSMLPLGTDATVVGITAKGLVRRRLLDLGLIKGTNVSAVIKSPLGDPTAYEIRGAIIALRQEEASYILMELIR